MNDFAKHAQSAYLTAKTNPNVYVRHSSASVPKVVWCLRLLEKQYDTGPEIQIMMPEFIESISDIELELSNITNKLNDVLSKKFGSIICMGIKVVNKWMYIQIDQPRKIISLIYVSSRVSVDFEQKLMTFITTKLRPNEYSSASYLCDESENNLDGTRISEFVYILGLYRRILDERKTPIMNNMFKKGHTNNKDKFDMLCELTLWNTLIHLHCHSQKMKANTHDTHENNKQQIQIDTEQKTNSITDNQAANKLNNSQEFPENLVSDSESDSEFRFGLQNNIGQNRCYANSILQIFLRIPQFYQVLLELEQKYRLILDNQRQVRNSKVPLQYAVVEQLIQLKNGICTKTSNIDVLENILLNKSNSDSNSDSNFQNKPLVAGLRSGEQFDSYEYMSQVWSYIETDQQELSKLMQIKKTEATSPHDDPQGNSSLIYVHLPKFERGTTEARSKSVSDLFQVCCQTQQYEKFSDILCVMVEKEEGYRLSYLDFSDKKPFKNKLMHKFHLFAINCHTAGTATSGHYYSYVLLDGSWIKFNDSMVTPNCKFSDICEQEKSNVRCLVYMQSRFKSKPNNQPEHIVPKQKLQESFVRDPTRWIVSNDIDLFLSNLEKVSNTSTVQKVCNAMPYSTKLDQQKYHQKNLSHFQTSYHIYDMLVSILNINSVHWIAIVYDTEKRSNVLEYMDPYGNEIDPYLQNNIINPLISWFPDATRLTVEVEVSKYPYQLKKDGYNCGVVCAWYIQQRVKGLTSLQIQQLAAEQPDRQTYFDNQRQPLFYDLIVGE